MLDFLRRHFNLMNTLAALAIGLAGLVIALWPNPDATAAARSTITASLKASLQELETIAQETDPVSRLAALDAFEKTTRLILRTEGDYFQDLKERFDALHVQTLSEIDQARLAEERRLALEKDAADAAAVQAEADRRAAEQAEIAKAAEQEAIRRAELDARLERLLAAERVCLNQGCTEYVDR